MKSSKRKNKEGVYSETIKKMATQIKRRRAVQQILSIPTPYMIEKVNAELDYREFYESELDLELGEVKGDGFISSNVICPFHDDKNPSLSINLETGFYNCFGCGKKGDIFKFYQQKHMIDDYETISALTKFLKFDGINDNDTRPRENGKAEMYYDYLDPDREIRMRVCRFGNKQFGQCCPDGNGGWVWNIQGVERIPYNLPEVIKANTVVIVEGEKDADNLSEIDITASCNPMGAGKWRDSYNQYFKGKHIIILPDNDDEGRKHAKQVANSLYKTAKSVKVLELPGLPEKGDVSDWLDAGNTKELLWDLIGNTDNWAPDTNLATPESDHSLTYISITDLLETEYQSLKGIIDKGILPEGGGLIIAGESEAGKSLITMEWAIRLSIKNDILGELFPVPKSRKVMIFQIENPLPQVQKRIEKMLPDFKIKNLPKKVFFANTEFQYDLLNNKCVEEMIGVVEDSGAEVFIIDSLSSFHSVNENDNSLMRSVLDKITYISRKTGAASIVLHHFGKPVEGRAERYRVRGASAIKDWCDTLITLTEKKHENKILRKITFEKLRFGEKIKPILLERNNETLIHHVTEEDMLITPKQVQELLANQFNGKVEKQGGLEKAICDQYNCSSRTARKAINEAEKMEMVNKQKKGRCNIISVNKNTGKGK